MGFQSAAENSGLKVDERISKIIQHYIIIERNHKKFTQNTLTYNWRILDIKKSMKIKMKLKLMRKCLDNLSKHRHALVTLRTNCSFDTIIQQQRHTTTHTFPHMHRVNFVHMIH